jgi:hypothetical protein
VLPIAERSGNISTRSRGDVALALIAAISTLAFAWSGFQSTEWVRDRFLLSDQAAAASQQSLELAAEADRLEERDTILFVEWLVAIDTGNPETAAIVFDLFRPPLQEFVRNVEVDEQGRPTETIFESVEYDVQDLREQSEALDREAYEQSAASREASRIAARYGGLGLLFAAVLASSGVAARFGSRVRPLLIVVASGLLTIGLVVMAMTPLSLFK